MSMPDLPGIPEEDEEHWTGDLLPMALEYLEYRRGREALGKREDTLKQELKDSMADEEADENGHRFFYFTDPLGKINGFKRERRVTQILDEDAAMEVVEKYKLQEKCLETIVVLNEDGLLAANFEGIIPDEEMKALYSEKEDFALVLVKEEQ